MASSSRSSKNPSVVILMADYGHDPTETAQPWQAFMEAGFKIAFATERGGNPPKCDSKMMEGWTGKLLGATKATITAYKSMAASPAFQNPLSWTAPDFDLTSYTLVHLPGGHDKGIRQIVDSAPLHAQLAKYFPLCVKLSSLPDTTGESKPQVQHAISAICHGVLVLARAPRGQSDNRSVLADATTTALHAFQEETIFWATRLVLGDYYKTYGANSDSVEAEVKAKLDRPEEQWKASFAMGGFVVEDPKYNYVSARFPGDVGAFSKKVVEMVQRF